MRLARAFIHVAALLAVFLCWSPGMVYGQGAYDMYGAEPSGSQLGLDNIAIDLMWLDDSFWCLVSPEYRPPGTCVSVSQQAAPTLSGPTLHLSINGNYDLSWTATAGATKYQLQRRKNQGSWSIVRDALTTAHNEKNIPDGSYDYRIRACGTDGCTPWSGTYNIGVLRTPAKPQLFVTGDPLLDASWSDTVNLMWTVSSGAVGNYQVDQEVNGVFKRIAEVTESQLTLAAVDGGIHKYRVRACNLFSCSSWSDVRQISVVKLNVPSTTGASFTVSWSGVPTTIQNLRLIEAGPMGTRDIPVQGKTSYAVKDRIKGIYSYHLRGDACSTTPYEGGGLTLCFPSSSLDKKVTVNIPGVEGPSSVVGSRHHTTVPVNPQVDHRGRLVANTPLSLPSGVNGVGPRLSLEYATPKQDKTGQYEPQIGSFMGYGWNLKGLQYIEKSGSGDYKLNGSEKLVLDDPTRISGIGRTYRLERNPNVRLVVEGQSDNEWFRLHSGDQILWFGKTSGARLREGSTEYWFVDEVKDVFSNGMTISYVKTSGNGKQRIYPRSINYGRYSIVFAYDYVDASRYGNLHLALSKISTQISGRYISEYRVEYRTTKQQRHISRVQRCGYSAGGGDMICSQPTNFGWRQLPIDAARNMYLPLIMHEVMDGHGVSTTFDYVHESEDAFWNNHLFSEKPFDPQFPTYLEQKINQQSHSAGEWIVGAVSGSTGIGTKSLTEYAYNSVSGNSSAVRRKLPDGSVEYTGYFFDTRRDLLYEPGKNSKVTNHERWSGVANNSGSILLEKSYTYWAEKHFSAVSGHEFYATYPCLTASFHVDTSGNVGIGKAIVTAPVWDGSIGLMTSKVVKTITGDIESSPPPQGWDPRRSTCNSSWTFASGQNPSNLAEANFREEIKTTKYDNDTGTWLVGFVSAEVSEHRNMSPGPGTVTTLHQSRLAGTLRASQITNMAGTAAEVTTTIVYDGNGNVTRRTIRGPSIEERTVRLENYLDARYPTSFINALGHEVAVSYDDRFGVATSTTDPNGLVTSELRDNLGVLKRVTQADGSQLNITHDLCIACPTVVGATPRYKVTKTVTHPAEGYQGAPRTITFHDQLGRVIRHEQEGFAGESIKIDTVYDDLGRVSKRSLPYVSGVPSFVRYSYDELRNRLTGIYYPDGSEKTYWYNDQAAGTQRISTHKIVGPAATKSQSRLEQFSIRGDLVKSIDAYGSADSVLTEYRYDHLGNSRWVRVATNSNTVVTTHYDLGANRRTVTDSSTGTTEFQLDALGQLIKQTDANNTVVTFQYDRLGRLIERIDNATGPDPITNNFTYDGPGAIGLLVSRSSPGFNENLAYDDLGRVVEIVTSVNIDGYSDTFRSTYAYDGYSRLVHQQHPSGLDTYTSYNWWGYAYELSDRSHVLSALEAADHMGNPTRMRLGNGLLTERTYDPYSGRLTRVITDSGHVQDDQYEWWSNGALHSRKKVADNITETFDYDDHNRLISAIAAGASIERHLGFAYDNLGNLIAKTSSIPSDISLDDYRYDVSKPYRLNSVDVDGLSHHFSFDNVGNIVRHQAPEISGDRHIVYNAYGKPTQITKGEIASPVAQEKIWYGPDGDRFYKLSQPSGNKTIYLYGGNFEVNIPARGSKVAIQKTYLGDVIHFREVDVSGAASERYAYVHKDHLGSLELMTDERGNPISAKGFDPFGDYRDATWSSADSSLASSEFTRGFTGHEHLDDVGLIHMNGRVYDPMLGRFMSPDPIVQSPNYSQSYNRYSYVWNNPVGMVDPTGYCGSISLTTPNIYCTVINVATEGNENEDRLRREFSQSHEWVGMDGTTTGRLRREFSQSHEWVGMDGTTTGRYRLISTGEVGAVGSIMFGSDAGSKFAAENVQIDVSFSGIGTNGGSIHPCYMGGCSPTGRHASSPTWDDVAMLPIVGDAVTIFDAVTDPSLGAISAAIIGIIPAVGDGVSVLFKSGHYASRLGKVGVDITRAESAIADAVRSMHPSMEIGAQVRGRMTVDGVLLEYRAMPLPNGTINVGTIFPVNP